MLLEIEEFSDERSLPVGMPMSSFWAVDDGYFFACLETLLSISPRDASQMMDMTRTRMQAEDSDARTSGKKPYVVNDGIAYVELVGPMTKRPNCMAEMFGGGGASTMRVRQSLRMAIRDSDVKSVMLLIESPGGEVNGAFDLASDVAKFNKIKPISAYIEDMGASAAYLVASQAGTVYANQNAVSGSIGVYQQIHDTSKAAANRGVKVHVIKAGEHKAIGLPGTEVTEEQLAVVQANANKLHGLFLRAVGRGRNMDAKALARVAGGNIFIGADGKRAGLIDNICTLDQAHAETSKMKRRKSAKGTIMAEVTENDVQQLLEQTEDIDDVTELHEDRAQAVVPIIPAPAPTPVTISSQMASVLQAAGIVSPEQFTALQDAARVGEDYATALRTQVSQLAVVAFGATDGPIMAAGVDSMTVPQLKAMNRQFDGIARSKGLIGTNGDSPGRQTLAQDIAGGIGDNQSSSSETNEGKTKATANTDAVQKNRNNFNNTGLYGL